MQKISLINKNIFPDYLNLHQKYHQAIRQQLETMNYQEVWCPPVSSSPCFETHVHPFRLNSPKLQNNLDLYLHTSPEFILKNYLLNNSSFSKSGIYNLNYVFRDDLPGPIHRRQFIMLEFLSITTTSQFINKRFMSADYKFVTKIGRTISLSAD